MGKIWYRHGTKYQVGSGGQAAFHWPQAGASSGWFGGAAAVGAKNRRIVLRFCGGSGDGEGGWDWSGEILPEGATLAGGVGRGVTTLRVRNRVTREVAFVRVGTSLKRSSVHLVGGSGGRGSGGCGGSGSGGDLVFVVVVVTWWCWCWW